MTLQEDRVASLLKKTLKIEITADLNGLARKKNIFDFLQDEEELEEQQSDP